MMLSARDVNTETGHMHAPTFSSCIRKVRGKHCDCKREPSKQADHLLSGAIHEEPFEGMVFTYRYEIEKSFLPISF